MLAFGAEPFARTQLSPRLLLPPQVKQVGPTLRSFPKSKMEAASVIAVAATVSEPCPIPTPSEAEQLLHNRPSLPVSLVPPSSRYRRRPARVLRLYRSLCRSLPIYNPKCKLPTPCQVVPISVILAPADCSASASPIVVDQRRSPNLITGTLFGYRRGRVSFSIQESPRCLPSLVVDLAMHTQSLLREMSAGMVRIALECEKKPASVALLEEPVWTMFCNGKKCGYGVRREATEDDLAVMEMLRAVSMGAGVTPAKTEAEEEMAYVRAGFAHVVGSRDSETLYMTSPDNGHESDLAIFFVRL